jgi:hypothetical protein
LNHILRVAERNYYQNELSKNQNNLRKSWQIIKSIINKNQKKCQKTTKFLINGKMNEDLQDIADHFNKIFTEIGPNLDKKIPHTNTDPVRLIPANYTVNIFLNPVDNEEMNKLVGALKDCAVGWDLLPAFVFKENTNLLTPLLTHLVNLSLEQGIFPAQLKKANIVPRGGSRGGVQGVRTPPFFRCQKYKFEEKNIYLFFKIFLLPPFFQEPPAQRWRAYVLNMKPVSLLGEK